ncbi:DNA-binding transcriptional regulator [Parelusimicrobium proximum]|uniref:TetR/AcrR family transcriptional regulator n=1 Tax=Parelusimicrobium proximum TaxID=3228953 RepID=UPI003D16B48E
MPSKTTVDLESKIIETAKEMFMESGFEGTSMSDIAAKAGINRPTLHYYFRTKDKMFQAVFGSLLKTLLPKIQEIFTEDIPFIDKIAKALDAYIDIFTSHPSLPKFVLSEVQRDISHLIAALEELEFDKYMKVIAAIVTEEMNSGRLKTVPISIVFVTFYGQMTFPFLSKKLLMMLFLDDEKGFGEFLVMWKKNLVEQMRNLLIK